MGKLHEHHNRFEEIAARLEGGDIGIMDKISLLWEQRKILIAWKRDIERLKRERAY